MTARCAAPGVRAAGGFTLIEALVAVTLLALLAGALMPLFQQGLAVLERGDRRTRAVMLAQSLLEEHAVGEAADGSIPVPAISGDDGDFTWQVTREPYDPATDGGPALEAQDLAVALVQVNAGVQWPGGGSGVRLSTLVMERIQ